MTERHTSPVGPLIAMPALTPVALRTAVAQLAPAQLSAYADHLDQAVEQAAAQSTIAPLQAFLRYWGEFVAIQRHPERAARLRQLEAAADAANDTEEFAPLATEIQEILAEASNEALG